jgi:hypothetical protein
MVKDRGETILSVFIQVHSWLNFRLSVYVSR